MLGYMVLLFAWLRLELPRRSGCRRVQAGWCRVSAAQRRPGTRRHLAGCSNDNDVVNDESLRTRAGLGARGEEACFVF